MRWLGKIGMWSGAGMDLVFETAFFALRSMSMFRLTSCGASLYTKSSSSSAWPLTSLNIKVTGLLDRISSISNFRSMSLWVNVVYVDLLRDLYRNASSLSQYSVAVAWEIP